LVWEQCGRNDQHGDLGFKVELPEFSSTFTTLTFVSEYQLEKEDKFIEKYFSVDWVAPPIYDIYPHEDDFFEEVIKFCCW
jgi:hypothetical protein